MKKVLCLIAVVVTVIATLVLICRIPIASRDVKATSFEPEVLTPSTQPQSEAPHEAVTEPSEAAETAEVETPEPLHIDAVPLSYALQDVMQAACEKYGVPYALALGVAECESSFRLDVYNSTGTCWGLMQINACNYPRLRENGIEPTEYEGNIVAGVFMLGELLEKYGDTHKALMAYNCGEYGASRLWEQGYLSSRYSRKVTECSEKWQQIIENNN